MRRRIWKEYLHEKSETKYSRISLLSCKSLSCQISSLANAIARRVIPICLKKSARDSISSFFPRQNSCHQLHSLYYSTVLPWRIPIFIFTRVMLSLSLSLLVYEYFVCIDIPSLFAETISTFLSCVFPSNECTYVIHMLVSIQVLSRLTLPRCSVSVGRTMQIQQRRGHRFHR